MTTLVDTSGLLAVLDSDDAGHARAARAWADLLRADEQLVTSSSILVEVYALTQRRLGMEAVRVLATDFEPLLDVVWVDAEVLAAALGAFLAAGQRALSLVDCTSFEVMRRSGIRRAFTLDADFARQGFEVVPRSRGASASERPGTA